MHRQPPFAIVAAVFCAAVFSKPVHAADERWLQIQGPHYRFVSDSPENTLRKIAFDLERFHEAFEVLWGKPPGKLVPCTVVVFAHDRDFELVKLKNRRDRALYGGYFHPGHDIAFIVLPLGNFDSAPRPTAWVGIRDQRRFEFHECIHYFLSGFARPPPLWLNEGLAELLSTVELGTTKATMGRSIDLYATELSHNAGRPIQEIFGVTPESAEYTDSERATSFYAHSWAFAHYLMCSRESPGLAALMRFLQLVPPGEPSAQNFQQAFGVDYAKFNKQLRAYLDGGRYSTRSIALKFATEENKFHVTALPPAEVDVIFGALLMHAGQYDLAQARLARAAAALPQEPEPRVRLGELAWQQDRYDESVDHFRAALALGSRSPIALAVAGADALQRSLAKLRDTERLNIAVFEQITPLLKTAINANPIFKEPYEALALAICCTDRPPEDDQVWLKQGAAVEPHSALINLALAYTHQRNRETIQARAALEGIARDKLPPLAQRRFDELQPLLATTR